MMHFLKGIAIGIANIIPGVSGGTLAIILGIYERLINSIKQFTPKIIPFIIKNIKDIKKIEKTLDLWFLILVLSGAMTGILIFAKVIKILILNYREQVMSFFLGLIVISIYFPLKLIKSKNIKTITFMILGALFVIFLSYLDTPEKKIEKAKHKTGIAEVDTKISLKFDLKENIKMFFSGIIGVSAMILPGISGSFVLVLMGVYFEILNYINNLTIFPLVFFSIGMVIGIVLMSNIISLLLKKFHDELMSFLTGLIIGSIIPLWPFKYFEIINDEKVYLYNILPQLNINTFTSVLSMIIGGFIVLFFIIYENKIKKSEV